MAVSFLTRQVIGSPLTVLPQAQAVTATWAKRTYPQTCRSCCGLLLTGCLSVFILTGCQNSDNTSLNSQPTASATNAQNNPANTSHPNVASGVTTASAPSSTNVLTLYTSVPKAQLQPLLTAYHTITFCLLFPVVLLLVFRLFVLIRLLIQMFLFVMVTVFVVLLSC